MVGPLTDHPAADRSTGTALCVEQGRSVVGLSSWLADACAIATQQERQLLLITPATTRITFPVEMLLAGSPHRWVTRAAVDRFYDGMSGQPLRWDGETFVTAGEAAAQHPSAPQQGLNEGRLRLDISVLHRATDSLEVGGAVEDCASALLGTVPAGWGVAEPATQPWSPRELTRFCRERAPKPSTLVVVAGTPPRRAVGTLTISRVTTGVLERLRLTLGSASGVDSAALDALAAALASRGARSLIAAWQLGRPDGTRGAEPVPPPLPLGLLVGAEQVAVLGADHARSVPARLVSLLGPERRPACWVRTDSADADRFTQFRSVLQHFGQASQS